MKFGHFFDFTKVIDKLEYNKKKGKCAKSHTKRSVLVDFQSSCWTFTAQDKMLQKTIKNPAGPWGNQGI